MTSKPRLGLLAFLLLTLLSACGGDERLSGTITGPFDTVTVVVAYGCDDALFDQALSYIEDELWYYHRLFDIYNSYGNLTNAKTINDNAGITPVSCDPALIELLSLAKDYYSLTDGIVDITLGPVLSLWHSAREKSDIPDNTALAEASALRGIEKLVIDGDTAFLTDQGMSIDLGAVAKGYAAGRIAQSLNLPDVFLINAGGNVVTSGLPPSGSWSVGLQDPDDTSLVATVLRVDDGTAVVTSGDYQRYFMYNGVRMSHIIDPSTLMPAALYGSVSVISGDYAIADALSTALFVMPQEEGLKLAQSLGCEAVWIYHGGELTATEGAKALIEAST